MKEPTLLPDLTRRNMLQTVAGTLATSGIADSDIEVATTETTNTQQFGPELIEQNEEAGFNFPYFLYAPANGRNAPILVECVNSGYASDDMSVHIDAAERTISYGLSRTVSDELGVPFIVPVIKDPQSGEFRYIRTQSLDTETMQIEDGRYARIDEQVVQMVDDARDRLSDYGYDLPTEFMLNGFSQSGNFGNNLALLQPDRVASVTAGGINGMGILPVDEAAGEEINYQIGMGDFEALTGTEFDEAAWRDISQLCYMGASERIPYDDTIPYSGVWADRDQAKRAVSVYGFDMQRERMVTSDAIYTQAGADTRFEVYDDTGHGNSNPKIVRDTIGFHAREIGVPYLTVVRGLVSGAEEVELEVFVPAGTGETQELRAFIDTTEVSTEPVTLQRGVSSRVRLPLTSALAVGDRIEFAVCPPGEPALNEALYTVTRNVNFGAQFRTVPQPGDTSVEIEYEVANTRVQLALVTDNGARYWQRETQLDPIDGPTSGTQIHELSQNDEGVPFEAGDTLELQANLDEDPRELNTVIDSVTVGDPDTYDPAARALGAIEDDAIDVAFRSPPTVDGTAIDVTCSVDSSYEQSVGLRLFPRTGAGRWGIGSDWDFESRWTELPSVTPGDSVSGEYSVPGITFAPTDRPALGTAVELRAYPDDWGRLSDVVASTTTVISGVRFTESPTAGTDTVAIKYLYPETFDQPGQVQLTIDGKELTTLTDIQPGTLSTEEIPIDTGTEHVTGELRVSLGPDTEHPFDTATQSLLPDAAGTVSFATVPEPQDQQVSLEYRLDSAVELDRFATLRLYTEQTSAWGVYLGRVEPGIDTTTTLDINPHEVCVPFQSDTDVTVKLVRWDDPYGTRPLATTTATVGVTPSLSDYTNTEGIVDTDGLRDAFDDWRAGDIESTLLRDVFGSWQRGEPVT